MVIALILNIGVSSDANRSESDQVIPMSIYLGDLIEKLVYSLANKTVVQLRPKSTTGNGFYWNISGTFKLGYDPLANFAVT